MTFENIFYFYFTFCLFFRIIILSLSRNMKKGLMIDSTKALFYFLTIKRPIKMLNSTKDNRVSLTTQLMIKMPLGVYHLQCFAYDYQFIKNVINGNVYYCITKISKKDVENINSSFFDYPNILIIEEKNNKKGTLFSSITTVGSLLIHKEFKNNYQLKRLCFVPSSSYLKSFEV